VYEGALTAEKATVKGDERENIMKFNGMLAMALGLSIIGTGCATKKYVAKTIAPVEQRVGVTETKDTDQDKTIAGHTNQLGEFDRELSQTKERVTTADGKAAQAGEAAKAADLKASGAQTSADGAKQAADGARSFAEQGLTKLDQNMQAMNKYTMATSEAVLFGFNQDTLTDEGKAQLDTLAKQATGMERYVIEVQGFTDKTGDATYNDSLSERRARNVARYLAAKYQIPVRSISVLGVGYAQPVADDATRDGRKMNRRVEVRLWVPGNESTKATAGIGGQ
jgi:outer membrane protein OmpA-like peptidoglycan-associated protein